MAKRSAPALRNETLSPESSDRLTRRGTGVRIAPSLLAADFSNLQDALKPLRPLALTWLHLDIMDGHFVPNISFGPSLVRSIRHLDEGMYFDVHLMISEPRRYWEQFRQAGAQNITFHVEAAEKDTLALLRELRAADVHAGLAIKPGTPVSVIRPYLEEADLILVMTVEPGFGGQELIPHTLNKVRELNLLRDQLGLTYLIQVDGGIDPQTAGLAVAAGADVLVAGTSVFRDGKVRENVRALRNSMSKLL